MNAKKAKKLRARANALTKHLPEKAYLPQDRARLGECTRGAYLALKSGRYSIVKEA